MVAQAGSYTAAGERLNISHSSLSRKVAHLEALLGVRLFNRRAYGVDLTIEGIDHLQRFRYALDQIRQTVGGRGGPQQKRVRISLLHSFATCWLFPRAAEIAAKSGDVAVEYGVERRTVEFREGIDLAIRFGLGDWSGVRAVRLWQPTLRPIAGQKIAEALGTHADPVAMLGFPLINLGAPVAWAEWLRGLGVEYEQRDHDHVFNDHAMVLSAVEHGLGIGLGRAETHHLIDGVKLRYIHPRTVPFERGFFLARDDLRPLTPAAEAYARAMLEVAEIPETQIEQFLA